MGTTAMLSSAAHSVIAALCQVPFQYCNSCPFTPLSATKTSPQEFHIKAVNHKTAGLFQTLHIMQTKRGTPDAGTSSACSVYRPFSLVLTAEKLYTRVPPLEKKQVKATHKELTSAIFKNSLLQKISAPPAQCLVQEITLCGCRYLEHVQNQKLQTTLLNIYS